MSTDPIDTKKIRYFLKDQGIYDPCGPWDDYLLVTDDKYPPKILESFTAESLAEHSYVKKFLPDDEARKRFILKVGERLSDRRHISKDKVIDTREEFEYLSNSLIEFYLEELKDFIENSDREEAWLTIPEELARALVPLLRSSWTWGNNKKLLDTLMNIDLTPLMSDRVFERWSKFTIGKNDLLEDFLNTYHVFLRQKNSNGEKADRDLFDEVIIGIIERDLLNMENGGETFISYRFLARLISQLKIYREKSHLKDYLFGKDPLDSALGRDYISYILQERPEFAINLLNDFATLGHPEALRIIYEDVLGGNVNSVYYQAFLSRVIDLPATLPATDAESGIEWFLWGINDIMGPDIPKGLHPSQKTIYLKYKRAIEARLIEFIYGQDFHSGAIVRLLLTSKEARDLVTKLIKRRKEEARSLGKEFVEPGFKNLITFLKSEVYKNRPEDIQTFLSMLILFLKSASLTTPYYRIKEVLQESSHLTIPALLPFIDLTHSLISPHIYLPIEKGIREKLAADSLRFLASEIDPDILFKALEDAHFYKDCNGDQGTTTLSNLKLSLQYPFYTFPPLGEVKKAMNSDYPEFAPLFEFTTMIAMSEDADYAGMAVDVIAELDKTRCYALRPIDVLTDIVLNGSPVEEKAFEAISEQAETLASVKLTASSQENYFSTTLYYEEHLKSLSRIAAGNTTNREQSDTDYGIKALQELVDLAESYLPTLEEERKNILLSTIRNTNLKYASTKLESNDTVKEIFKTMVLLGHPHALDIILDKFKNGEKDMANLLYSLLDSDVNEYGAPDHGKIIGVALKMAMDDSDPLNDYGINLLLYAAQKDREGSWMGLAEHAVAHVGEYTQTAELLLAESPSQYAAEQSNARSIYDIALAGYIYSLGEEGPAEMIDPFTVELVTGQKDKLAGVDPTLGDPSEFNYWESYNAFEEVFSKKEEGEEENTAEAAAQPLPQQNTAYPKSNVINSSDNRAKNTPAKVVKKSKFSSIANNLKTAIDGLFNDDSDTETTMSKIDSLLGIIDETADTDSETGTEAVMALKDFQWASDNAAATNYALEALITLAMQKPPVPAAEKAINELIEECKFILLNPYADIIISATAFGILEKIFILSNGTVSEAVDALKEIAASPDSAMMLNAKALLDQFGVEF